MRYLPEKPHKVPLVLNYLAEKHKSFWSRFLIRSHRWNSQSGDRKKSAFLRLVTSLCSGTKSKYTARMSHDTRTRWTSDRSDHCPKKTMGISPRKYWISQTGGAKSSRPPKLLEELVAENDLMGKVFRVIEWRIYHRDTENTEIFRAEGWGLRTEGWGLRTEDWGLRAEGWGLRGWVRADGIIHSNDLY